MLLTAVIGLLALMVWHASRPRDADGIEPDTCARWKRLLAIDDAGSSRTLPEPAGDFVQEAPLVPRRRRGEDLRTGLDLAKDASAQDVRAYIAQILTASKRRQVRSLEDPEFASLARVGPRNLGVLLEPLACAGEFEGRFYVVQAVLLLASADHKELVLRHLGGVPELVTIVVAQGWIEEAAQELLGALEARSRYLPPDWAVAAAQVAGAENYDDLKFQLAYGLSPLDVWQAARGLPGIEPMSEFVGEAWRRARAKDPDSYKTWELAVVAAHYGYADALNVFTDVLSSRPWWIPMHELLLQYGESDEAEYLDSADWYRRHQHELEFDENTGRYSVRDK